MNNEQVCKKGRVGESQRERESETKREGERECPMEKLLSKTVKSFYVLHAA